MCTVRLKILIMVSFVILSSCSTNTPEIKDSFLQVNIFNDREKKLVYHKLSAFIIPYDGDGFEDLSVIYIINDSEELFWAVSSEDWIKGNKDGDDWIGTNSLTMPELKDFPKGEYRIVLEDLGGESVERTAFLTYRDTDKSSVTFPYISTDENNLYIQGINKGASLWIYDNDNYMDSLFININGINREQLFPESEQNTRYCYIYYFDTDLNTGIITGPFFSF